MQAARLPAGTWRKSDQSSSFCRGGPPLLPQASSPKPSSVIDLRLEPELEAADFARIGPWSAPGPGHAASDGERSRARKTPCSARASGSLLHRLALARVLAPEVDAVLVGRRHRGRPPWRTDISPPRRSRAACRNCTGIGRHVVAEVGARDAVAALVGVGELIVKRHAGAGPAALDDFGELLAA